MSDGTSKQFEDDIRVRQQQKVDAYISLFRDAINDIVQLKSKEDEMTELKHYTTALIEYANDIGRMDAYSKAKIFNVSLYNKVKVEEISKLIKSVRDLIETVTFRDIVEKHIPTEKLKALLKELIETYQNFVVENAIKKEANAIIKDVRSTLQRKSAPRPYTSATDVKAQYGKQCSLVEAFKCYDNPLTYKNKLIEANIS